MKGFSTKYALTTGIRAVDVEADAGDKYVYIKKGGWNQLVVGRTFFTEVAAAELNAKAQASKKIAAHKRAIVDLEKLESAPRWHK